MGVIHTHDFEHPENEPVLAGDGFAEMETDHRELHDQLAPKGLYERISLEFSSTWPGQAYLRFEASGGVVVMVAVNGTDCRVLARLLEKVS